MRLFQSQTIIALRSFRIPTAQLFIQNGTLVLCFLLPLLLTWIRYLVTDSFPVWDASDYLVNTYNIIASARFHGNSLLDWIWDMYMVRGWRPIAHPTIAAPLFSLFPNTSSTTSIIFGYTIVLNLVLLSFIAATFWNILPRYQVGLLVLLVGTLPWVNKSMSEFMSENPYMVFSVAAIFFTSRSNFFLSRRFSLAAGLCFGVATTLRPVEMLFALLPAALIYIGHAIYLRKLPVSGIYAAFPAFLATLVCILYSIYLIPLSLSPTANLIMVLSVAILSTFPFLLSLKNHHIRGWSNFFFFALVIPVAWFLPFIRELYYWAMPNTYGDLAKSSPYFGLKEDQGYFFLLHKCWLSYFNVTVTLLFLVAVLCAVDWARRHSLKNVNFKQGLWIGATLLILLNIHLSIASTGYNSEIRMYQLESLLLTILSAMVIFICGKSLKPILNSLLIYFLIAIVGIHSFSLLAECEYYGENAKQWSRDNVRDWIPQLTLHRALNKEWYWDLLHLSQFNDVKTPDALVKILVIEPKKGFSHWMAIETARAGILAKVDWRSIPRLLSEHESNIQKCFKNTNECPYEWLYVGPIESDGQASETFPDFYQWIFKNESSINPKKIIFKNGEQSVEFWIRHFEH